MNFWERNNILVDVIGARINEAVELRYKSYLKTKQYGYEKINKFFDGRNVLELGSDESSTSSILVRWSEKLTIVDVQNKFSRQVEKDRALKSACFIQAKWEEFVPNELYSDILLTDSLEHVEEPRLLLNIVSRWLADDGRLHVIVPNARSVHRLLGVEMGLISTPFELNSNDIDSGHQRVYDTNALKHDIKLAGLELLTLEGVQFKPMTDVQLSTFSEQFQDALNKLSVHFNEYCAEIYACCYRKN
ncbi:methyltransferase domain-containing protein [Methylomonas sp. YC3]